MYEGKTVGVVIVAYNEEGLVGDVIDDLPAFVDRAYVVDDCSTDGTWAEIRTHAQKVNERRAARATDTPSQREKARPIGDGQMEITRGDGGFEQTVVPIRHETNTGVGGARKTGYRHAYQDEMDVTVAMDGDGQMDLGECHRIVAPVAEGKTDYAKGNRLLTPELREDMSSWRLFGNMLLTGLTKIASGYWKMMDPANGYTAISYEALDELDIDAVYDGYGALHDVLIRLNVKNKRIADVPLPAAYGEEESGIEYSSFVPNLSWLLLRGFLWRLKTKYLVRDCHPFVFLYGLGFFGTLAATVEALRSAVDSDSSRTQSLLATLLFLVSASLMAFGMIFDMLDNQDLVFRDDE